MSFLGWLKDHLSGKAIPVGGLSSDLIEEYCEAYGDIYIRELAFWSAVNMIARTVSKCEFKTFKENEEERGDEYYLWNVEPNKNQNSSSFIQQWISQLYRKNECLIIEHDNDLLIADSFTRKPYAMLEDIFSDVQIGDFLFRRSFRQSEVLYFKLNSVDMSQLINGLYSNYAKLIGYSMKAYQKSRGTKGTFSYGSMPVAGSRDREVFDDLVNNRIAKWLSADNGALPLGNGQEWKELTQRTYSNESTRDIRAMIDDVSDFTSKAFCIPPALLRGDVAGVSDALDQYLTFCIDPLLDMLQEEINRKRTGKSAYKKGSYLQIDSKAVKHVDLLSVSTSVDKLIASGAFSVNDIRELVGEPKIDETWANRHYITKNYQPFEEGMMAVKGGDSI